MEPEAADSVAQIEKDSFTPVSYTHLDVYKRQVWYHALVQQ